MCFGDLFLLKASNACAGVFLSPSLLLRALLAHSLLAVPVLSSTVVLIPALLSTPQTLSISVLVLFRRVLAAKGGK